ncbi:hypothetical protein OIY81_3048 [Cryptosporidium canis]|uniref:Uncharacterized protein n=1 Tax=Cryptosporidium canis TaxID=195482 RepID=A0ABQ8PA94_9CRYT|nr:hypothetical protein OIY81_3048 [Cryptosporidium canis]KAJ1614186.1 hypothetical protein OJ252_790 [Cryptosporidium canis]
MSGPGLSGEQGGGSRTEGDGSADCFRKAQLDLRGEAGLQTEQAAAQGREGWTVCGDTRDGGLYHDGGLAGPGPKVQSGRQDPD